MKRCPTCNQTFSETWLSFCTQDGTTLVDDSASKSDPLDPMATMMAPAPPLLSNSNQPANWNPPGGLGSGQFQPPQPLHSAWHPPPPPAYSVRPTQGDAVASIT